MTVYTDHNGQVVPRTSNVLNLLPTDLKGFAAREALNEAYVHATKNGLPLRHSDLRGFKDAHLKTTDLACRIGTVSHCYIERYLSKVLSIPDMSGTEDQEKQLSDLYGSEHLKISDQCFRSFLKFDAEVKPEYIATEMTGVSTKHGYGGTVDCLAIVGGVKTIIDWKTSARIYRKYNLQMGAYYNLAEEKGFEADQCIIARFDKKKPMYYEPVVRTKEELINDFDIFKAMLVAYKKLEDGGYFEREGW